MAILHYAPPLSPYLDIMYQDNDIVVLNKPPGLLSVPGKHADHKDCLESRVQRVFPSATIVHRLDMATSGILIMALNKPAHVHISRQLEQRQTKKAYYARVYGHPTQSEGSVDLPLICDWPNRPKQMVDHERGKPSLTHWQLLQKGAYSSLLKLTPVTGRSHQIRVHMLALGHPILGDRLYAHEKALTTSPRLQLHAKNLSLAHPSSGELIAFSAPCPFS